MAAEGARGVSSSRDVVVLEVQDCPLQECMMLVRKFSETSLGASGAEKSNLSDLLAKAQKEELRIEATLRALRDEVDCLRVQKEDADEQISLLNTRLKKERQKLVVVTEESEERIISLENLLNARQTEMEDLKTRSNAEIQKLRDELGQQQTRDSFASACFPSRILELREHLEKINQENEDLSRLTESPWEAARKKQAKFTKIRDQLSKDIVDREYFSRSGTMKKDEDEESVKDSTCSCTCILL